MIEFYKARTDTKVTIAAERLALIAVLTLPITALSSVYGMNIIVNDRTDFPHLAAVVAAMAIISAILLRWPSNRDGCSRSRSAWQSTRFRSDALSRESDGRWAPGRRRPPRRRSAGRPVARHVQPLQQCHQPVASLTVGVAHPRHLLLGPVRAASAASWAGALTHDSSACWSRPGGDGTPAAVELANLTGPTLAEVITQAHRGIERVRRTPHLAYSFLRHAGLPVS